MRAEMAFRGGAIIRIHVNRIVGTGLHAGLAANAAVGVEIDDPVLALVHRGHRTDRDAGRLLAMIAARDLKYAARVWENALLDVLHPGPIHAYWHMVFGFARHRAGVASDAFAVIDYEAVFHPLECSTRSRQSYLGTFKRGVSVLGRRLNSCHRKGHGGPLRTHKTLDLRGPSCTIVVNALDLIINVFHDPLQRFGKRLTSARAFQLTARVPLTGLLRTQLRPGPPKADR